MSPIIVSPPPIQYGHYVGRGCTRV
jgi:hypothetical protein